MVRNGHSEVFDLGVEIDEQMYNRQNEGACTEPGGTSVPQNSMLSFESTILKTIKSVRKQSALSRVAYQSESFAKQ